jgi:hypothetical protein
MKLFLYWADSYTVIHAIMETIRHVKSGEVEGWCKVAGLMIDCALAEVPWNYVESKIRRSHIL